MSIPSVAEMRPPVDDEPVGRHLRDRLLSLDDLAAMPPVRPLVDGLLYRGTLAQLAGPPGSYKSFIAIGWPAPWPSA